MFGGIFIDHVPQRDGFELHPTGGNSSYCKTDIGHNLSNSQLKHPDFVLGWYDGCVLAL